MYKFVLLFFFSVSILSCNEKDQSLSTVEFKTLMNNVAQGWSTLDTDLALSSFDEDAIYMEPPNVQYFRGHDQLRPYFDELEEHHQMVFHQLWFDETTQTGAGEFTFSYGEATASVGIAIVELKNGKISFWREYFREGPTDFTDFLRIEGKEWEWHIGNYPEPKVDSIQ